VAWSPTLGGLPVEDDVAGVLSSFVATVESLGWSVDVDEPDFEGADESFRILRAFNIACGRGVMLGDRLGEVKATVQDEVARGRALSSSELGWAMVKSAELWQRGVGFFSRYDLLIAPVTQVSPFPVELEHPSEVAGQPMTTYIDWMKSNCRITSLGLPALSLPAGFTPAGLPVGAQLVGAPWGDLDLLRAAKALEAATGFGNAGPELSS
jgi:amidase